MSPSVGNFVHDLVEMAKAMETLPQVQGELDKANTVIEDQAKTIQAREISILDLKSQIETLNQRIRDAEVSRDDAEMRFLELDEKTHHVLSALGNLESSARTIRSELTPPPKPEPVKAIDNPMYDDPQMPAEPPQGQSESHPIASSTESQSTSIPSTAENTVNATAADTPQQATTKPYEGEFYYDHPVYVSLHDWLAGGGSEENYYRSKPREYGSF